VFLTGRPDGLHLRVSDAGEGFDMEGQRSGLGLISIEERARIMHAAFSVDSSLGKGTTITVDVPLPVDPEA
jgi:signal transduction histidine kinase